MAYWSFFRPPKLSKLWSTGNPVTTIEPSLAR